MKQSFRQYAMHDMFKKNLVNVVCMDVIFLDLLTWCDWLSKQTKLANIIAKLSTIYVLNYIFTYVNPWHQRASQNRKWNSFVCNRPYVWTHFYRGCYNSHISEHMLKICCWTYKTAVAGSHGKRQATDWFCILQQIIIGCNLTQFISATCWPNWRDGRVVVVVISNY